jgi:hypothetical protein
MPHADHIHRLGDLQWGRNGHVESSDGLLAAQGVTDLPWLVLPVDELEKLQPHLAAGINLGATIDELRDATSDKVLGKLHEQTNLVYKDSFLYAKDEQLFRLLGV